MKADPLSFELQVKLLSVGAIKTLDRDNRNVPALFAA